MLSWSNDGRYLAVSGFPQGSSNIYTLDSRLELASNEPVKKLPGHKSVVNHITFCSNDRNVLTISDEESKLWNLPKASQSSQSSNSTGTTSQTASADTVGTDPIVISTFSLAPFQSLVNPLVPVSNPDCKLSFSYSPRSNQVSCFRDYFAFSVPASSRNTGPSLAMSPPPSLSDISAYQIFDFIYPPTTNSTSPLTPMTLALFGTSTGHLALTKYPFQASSPVLLTQKMHSSAVSCIAVSKPISRTVLSSSVPGLNLNMNASTSTDSGSKTRFDHNSLQGDIKHSSQPDSAMNVNVVCSSPRFFATGGVDGTLTVLDAGYQPIWSKFANLGPGISITGISFSPDTSIVAVWNDQISFVAIFDAYTGTSLNTFHFHRVKQDDVEKSHGDLRGDRHKRDRERDRGRSTELDETPKKILQSPLCPMELAKADSTNNAFNASIREERFVIDLIWCPKSALYCTYAFAVLLAAPPPVVSDRRRNQRSTVQYEVAIIAPSTLKTSSKTKSTAIAETKSNTTSTTTTAASTTAAIQDAQSSKPSASKYSRVSTNGSDSKYSRVPSSTSEAKYTRVSSTAPESSPTSTSTKPSNKSYEMNDHANYRYQDSSSRSGNRYDSRSSGGHGGGHGRNDRFDASSRDRDKDRDRDRYRSSGSRANR